MDFMHFANDHLFVDPVRKSERIEAVVKPDYVDVVGIPHERPDAHPILPIFEVCSPTFAAPPLSRRIGSQEAGPHRALQLNGLNE